MDLVIPTLQRPQFPALGQGPEDARQLGYTRSKALAASMPTPPPSARSSTGTASPCRAGISPSICWRTTSTAPPKIAKTLGDEAHRSARTSPPDQRPTDAAGWPAFGERLGKVGEKAKKAGFDFAWHNHDFEFEPLADGSVPQKHILDAAPDIGWEMDVAWVVRGGADPLKWIDDYGQRISRRACQGHRAGRAERRRGRLGRCRPRHRRLGAA